jgi:hypothetical protein
MNWIFNSGAIWHGKTQLLRQNAMMGESCSMDMVLWDWQDLPFIKEQPIRIVLIP